MPHALRGCGGHGELLQAAAVVLVAGGLVGPGWALTRSRWPPTDTASGDGCGGVAAATACRCCRQRFLQGVHHETQVVHIHPCAPLCIAYVHTYRHARPKKWFKWLKITPPLFCGKSYRRKKMYECCCYNRVSLSVLIYYVYRFLS